MNDTQYDPYNVKSQTIWAIEAVGLMSVIIWIASTAYD